MKLALKMFIRNIHRYVLWAVISVVLWSWIFMLATDAPRTKKVVVYIDAPSVDERGLMLELERELPEGIRFVNVSSFESLEYGMYLDDADIYVLPESKLSEISDRLAPLPFNAEGRSAGGRLIAAKLGGSSSFIGGEDLYICISASSAHSGLEGSKDDAAVIIAERMLKLEKTGGNYEKTHLSVCRAAYVRRRGRLLGGE